MKEQIVEMSGLSPRVIRVWFQNKRCKDKKNQIKQELQQEKVNLKTNESNLFPFSVCVEEIYLFHSKYISVKISKTKHQKKQKQFLTE